MMHEVIEKIKEFLNGKNAKFNVGQPEETVNGTTLVEVKFGEPIELTEGEYDELYNFLKSLGFLPSDIWENRVLNS